MSAPSNKAAKPVRYALLTAVALTWAGAFVATHLPPDSVPNIHASDKVAHGIGYGVLAMLLAAALTCFGRARTFRIVIAMAILLAYGAFDELTQPAFLRVASFGDWLADAAGAAGALVFWESILAVVSAARRKGRTA